ncbi:MAG: hypothetical protein U9N56_08100 [Actinomycetota bacterium]|nr:hypothetical protein [Actinomycetota bacterium]
MAGDLRVIADGLEPEGPNRSKTPSAMVLIVGVLSGLVFGVLLFSSTVGDDPDSASSSTLPLEASAPTLPRFGVTGTVPEFPDALVAVAGDSTGSDDGVALNHVLWPATSDEVTRPLIEGNPGPAAFDVAGTWLAVSTVMEDGSGLELKSGRGILQLVGDGVTGFAWHDSESGILSYTTSENGQLGLHTFRGSANPKELDSTFLRSGLVKDGSIAAWGDWGWAIQEFGGTPQVWLLDSDAGFVSLIPGLAYGSHPSGEIIVVDGEHVNVVDPNGSPVEMERTVRAVGPVAAATISPDGSKLAVLGLEGLVVFPLGGEGIVAEFDPIVGFPQAAWSSDSRFVLVPGPTGVSVIDTKTNTAVEALTGQLVYTVGVIPLAAPS